MADIDSGGNKNFTFRTMKTNCWLILGMLMATGALAQDNTNALPPIPAPLIAPPVEVTPPVATETNAPAAKPARHKKHHVAPKLVEPTVALVPGTAEVTVSNLNVRGQAGLKGEVIGHLVKGDAVTVIGQINLDKHAAGEPAQWAKIGLPASVKIWLDAKFIDPTNNTVLSKKLNLRAGPGENYSVLGNRAHHDRADEHGRCFCHDHNQCPHGAGGGYKHDGCCGHQSAAPAHRDARGRGRQFGQPHFADGVCVV